MNKAIGHLATWIAGACVLGATIVFGLAQTTNFVDSVLLCGILTALALFGKSMATVAKTAFLEDFYLKFAVTVILIIALDAMQIFEVYGWKSNMDYLFGESTQAAQTDKLKIELATAKVKMLEVGKVDSAAEYAKIEAMEAEAAKCKHAWSWSCKDKARAGKAEIVMKLDAQKQSVQAITEAQNDIKSTEANSGNYVHRAFKGMALLIDAEVLKVQSGYRLAIATLVVLLYSLGDILFAYPEKRKPREIIDDLKSGISEIKHPAPAYAPINQHHDPIVNRMYNRPTQPVQQPEIKAGHIEDLAEAVDRKNESTRLGFIGFCDPNDMPKPVSVKKPVSIERESLSTPVRVQTDTDTKRNTVSGGNGRGLDDLEPVFLVLVNSLRDQTFFKSENAVGVNSIKRACKVGTAKAQVLMTMLLERNIDTAKK